MSLEKQTLRWINKNPFRIYYEREIVGDYVCDLLVEQAVIVELKVVRGLDEIHLAQRLNYLNTTGLKLCLLINFGTPKVQIKRIVNKL